MNYMMRSMTWPEVAQAAREARVVLLPVGSIEQHGPHLPLDLDLITAEYLALEGARTASRLVGAQAAIVAPSIPFGGPERGMTDWPGTLTLRPHLLIDVLTDVTRGLVRSGFETIAVVNGCFGNLGAIDEACRRLEAERPGAEVVHIPSIWQDREVVARVRESGPGGTGHACEIETSVALVVCPEQVHMDRAVDEIPSHPSGPISFDFTYPGEARDDIPFGELTRSGVMGRATLATQAKGEEILRAAVERVAREILALHRAAAPS